MNPLIIANTQIRCDPEGRYCLNDLHQASGGAKRHQPTDWVRLQKTVELVTEIESEDDTAPGIPGAVSAQSAIVTIMGGLEQGTYAVKELVYAYAMWISAKFHLHVIRAYDALVAGKSAVPEIQPPLLGGPEHRADQLVSAGRIFTAALRAGRAIHLPPNRALRAAFDCARRHAGIDWAEELGVSNGHGTPPLDDEGAYAGSMDNDIVRFHTQWLAGELHVPYAPARVTDVYEIYVRWCIVNRVDAVCMHRFSGPLTACADLRIVRKRWTAKNGLQGPHAIVVPGEPIESRARKHEASWLGEHICAFMKAMEHANFEQATA